MSGCKSCSACPALLVEERWRKGEQYSNVVINNILIHQIFEYYWRVMFPYFLRDGISNKFCQYLAEF